MAVLLNKADALLSMPIVAEGEGGDQREGSAPLPLRPRAGEGGGGWGEEGDDTTTTTPPTPESQPTPEQHEAAQRRLAELEQWYRQNCRAEAVFVGSARGGAADAGVAAVRAWAVSRLPEGPTLYPKSMVSEQPERFFVAEIIRERIFALYGQEIPYAAQVQVEEFRERRARRGGGKGEGKGEGEGGGGAAAATAAAAAAEEEEEGETEGSPPASSSSTQQQQPKDYISASILLERESQVAIVVGTGGKKLRRLGAEARREIEGFLGRPVYLELAVRVAPGWRESPERLREFGYYSDLYI
jgi:GTP-binding protein Era